MANATPEMLLPSTLSPDHRRRVVESLDSVNRIIEREMRYAPDLRNQEYLAAYEAARAKLVGMLA